MGPEVNSQAFDKMAADRRKARLELARLAFDNVHTAKHGTLTNAVDNGIRVAMTVMVTDEMIMAASPGLTPDDRDQEPWRRSKRRITRALLAAGFIIGGGA